MGKVSSTGFGARRRRSLFGDRLGERERIKIRRSQREQKREKKKVSQRNGDLERSGNSGGRSGNRGCGAALEGAERKRGLSAGSGADDGDFLGILESFLPLATEASSNPGLSFVISVSVNILNVNLGKIYFPQQLKSHRLPRDIF